jgi:PAS domain S-box-containing protein
LEHKPSDHDLLGTVSRNSSSPHLVVDPTSDTILAVNDSAIKFYNDLGIDPQEESLTNFLTGESIDLWEQLKKTLLNKDTIIKDHFTANPPGGDPVTIPVKSEAISLPDNQTTLIKLVHVSWESLPEPPISTNPDGAKESVEERAMNPINRSTLPDYPDDVDRSLFGEYRTLISNVPGVVYRCEYDSDWTMHFISEEIEELSGYPKEDLINNNVRTYASLIHPEDRKKVERNVRKGVRQDEMFELEYRIVDSDDRVHWVLERGQGIRNPQDEVVCLEGVILEINERKLAKKELEKNERRYRSLFENAEVGIAEISFDERWLSVNDRLQEILGYDEEELLEMKCRDITHPDHIEEDEKCTRAIMNGETNYYVTNKRYQQKNGDYVWVRMTVSRVDIPRGDHEGYFVAIIEDIQERKQYEKELEELVDEKETLLKEVHHRVKNNLQMIISLLNMQETKASSQEASTYLEESAGRIRSMALLHEKLYRQQQFSSVDFESYVRSLSHQILGAHETPNEELSVELHVDNDEIDLNTAIPSGLILNELLTNSIEHGHQDISEVTIQFSSDNGNCQLIVSDDGPGFPEGFTIEDTDSLGLTMVETLAEHDLNGEVNLENDGGANVKVNFPR